MKIHSTGERRYSHLLPFKTLRPLIILEKFYTWMLIQPYEGTQPLRLAKLHAVTANEFYWALWSEKKNTTYFRNSWNHMEKQQPTGNWYSPTFFTTQQKQQVLHGLFTVPH